jgi:TrmH family RNA methyltransferase
MLQKITSRDNSRVQRARRVRDGREAGSIFIEGRRLVDEAVRSGLVIEDCFITEGRAEDTLSSLMDSSTESFAQLSDKVFDSLADTKQPQGIIIIAQRPITGAALLEKSLNTSSLPVVVFLHETNDPSNLGAVLRTAEAAAAAGVIVSDNSADVFSPKSLRASMGAAFRLAIWQGVHFHEVLEWAKAHGLTATATAASSKLSYTQIDWREPRLIVLGSEAHGLSSEQLAAVSETINIPMNTQVESLNLAVSAGVILFEAKRQVDLDR